MRILQTAHNLTYGDGQGRINLEIARRALKLGHQVTVIADAFDPILEAGGATCIRLRPKLRQPNLLKVWSFARMANDIIRKIRKPDDVVVANGFTLTEPHDLNLCQFVHCEWAKSAVHVSRLNRGPYGWYQWQYTVRNTKWEAKAYASARTVVSPSRKIVGDLTRSGVSPQKIRVIYNGVDLKEFEAGPADRRTLGLASDGVLALFAGDIRTPRKNLDSVLKALVKTPNLRLAVVGDANHSPFPNLAQQLGVADRVKFLGYRRDVSQVMRACDFYVFQSRYEAGALVILEALAAGLPVITAASSGGAELVDDAGTVLAHSEDIAGLARAMNRLAVDPDHRARQGEAARRIARQHTWTRMADEYLHLLETSQ
jgi:glycosyltransferase involved in cell wall biosynthesis